MDQDTGGLSAWGGSLLGAGGTAALALIGGGLALWRKFRSDRAASDTDDLAVKVKVSEAMDKERARDADYREAEEQRAVAHWKAINAEMSTRFTERWNEIQATVTELLGRIDKLQDENVECQKSDARKTVEIEYLRESNTELRTRVTALEKRTP